MQFCNSICSTQKGRKSNRRNYVIKKVSCIQYICSHWSAHREQNSIEVVEGEDCGGVRRTLLKVVEKVEVPVRRKDAFAARTHDGVARLRQNALLGSTSRLRRRQPHPRRLLLLLRPATANLVDITTKLQLVNSKFRLYRSNKINLWNSTDFKKKFGVPFADFGQCPDNLKSNSLLLDNAPFLIKNCPVCPLCHFRTLHIPRWTCWRRSAKCPGKRNWWLRRVRPRSRWWQCPTRSTRTAPD